MGKISSQGTRMLTAGLEGFQEFRVYGFGDDGVGDWFQLGSPRLLARCGLRSLVVQLLLEEGVCLHQVRLVLLIRAVFNLAIFASKESVVAVAIRSPEIDEDALRLRATGPGYRRSVRLTLARRTSM